MFPIKQHQRFAIGFWNPFQRPPEDFSFLPVHGPISWPWLRRARLGHVLQRRRAVARLPPGRAQEVVDQISGDAAKPGPQLGRLAQFRQMLPRGNKSFLRQILALGQTAGGAEGQRADERLVARDDLCEGLTISRQAGVDQILVSTGGRRCHCACHHIAVTVVGKPVDVTRFFQNL